MPLLRRGAEAVEFDAHDEFTTKASWKVGALPEASLAYPLVVDLAHGGRVTDQRELRRSPSASHG